jgi:hypothetical protein
MIPRAGRTKTSALLTHPERTPEAKIAAVDDVIPAKVASADVAEPIVPANEIVIAGWSGWFEERSLSFCSLLPQQVFQEVVSVAARPPE